MKNGVYTHEGGSSAFMNSRKCNDEVGYSPSNNGTPLCSLTTTYTVRSYLSIHT